MAATGFAPSGQQRELLFRAVDYLDWGPNLEKVLQYTVSNNQDFLKGSGGPDLNDTGMARLQDISCWVLPRAANAQIATSTFQALYSTPAVPALDVIFDSGTSDQATSQVAQRSTTVNPTFNTKWVQVGYTNFDRVFASSNLMPVAGTNDQRTTVGFSLALIDPDDGSTFTDPVQLMVVSTFAQTLPLTTSVRAGTTYTSSFNSVAPSAIGDKYAMVELLRLQDAI